MNAPIVLRDAEGAPTHVIVDYRRAVAAGLLDPTEPSAEDRADLADLATADPDSPMLPLAEVRRLLAGEHVVGVLRRWRGLSQGDLAERMATTANYISQIETGARRGVRRSADFAAALDVPEPFLRARL